VIARIVGLVLLAVATLYALDRWALRPLRCIHAAAVDGELLDQAAKKKNDRTLRLARRTLGQLDDCECVSPPDVVIPFARGAASEILGDYKAAIAEYERALQIDRRPEIYFRLGVTQLNALDRPSAIENLTRACAFDPKLLNDIPYEDVRKETKERLRGRYSRDWMK